MVNEAAVTAKEVWATLADVMDPEIPVISVVELGLIRGVQVEDGSVVVEMTPTFLGCPAIELMQNEIRRRLQARGASGVEVRTILSPPWTSEWITEAGRAKLKAYGLAPPVHHNGLVQVNFSDEAECPHCGSHHTEQKNPFGATLCRALYYCRGCRQPFEQFKAL
jgi:ring-1,2-phenylacetyl-CoA epoxidase subunit PaaD